MVAIRPVNIVAAGRWQQRGVFAHADEGPRGAVANAAAG